jgi:integrase
VPKAEDALSDALELYLKWHEKRDDDEFVEYTRRTFKTVIAALGDKPMSEFNRADARAYVTHQMKPKGSSKTVTTTTVRRRINTLKAVFGFYLREKEVNRTNPFSGLSIPNEGQDTTEREPLTADELAKVIDQCRQKDDPIRWLIAMLADTGARLAEITGLALDDIHLKGPIPYVDIQPHPWRSLKTTGSARQVPLLGAALWAAKRVKEQAAKGDVYAFARYVKEGHTDANTASATVNKWIRSLGMDHTAHELRHTMKDRLREVQCPEDIRFAIGGWTNAAVGDGYGKGYSLKVKAEWLSKVAGDTKPGAV